MADMPTSLIEKFYGLKAHYRVTGKAWDSKAIKPVLIRMHMEARGLRERPTDLDEIPDDSFPESDERARAIRFDERIAKEELAAIHAEGNAAIAREKDKDHEIEMLRARIAQLEAGGSASAPHEAPAAPSPQPVEPEASPTPPPAPGSLPTERWTREQLLAYAVEQRIEVPAEIQAAGTKAELREFLLGELEARE